MIKKMDLNEFRQFGFLQEVNRQFFHPLGLALEINIDDVTGTIKLGGIWDSRDDPEGFIFSDLSDIESIEKEKRVSKLFDEKSIARKRMLGFIIQPIGDNRDKKIEKRTK